MTDFGLRRVLGSCQAQVKPDVGYNATNHGRMHHRQPEAA